MTTTTGLSKLMFKAFLETVETSYKDQPDYSKDIISDTITTTQLWEEIVQVEGLGPMGQMNEAGGIPFDQPFAPYSKKFYWKIFGIGWERSYDAEDTDQSGWLKRFGEWAGTSRWWALQTYFADVINYMTDTGAAYAGMDGKPLISTTHPIKGGGTFSNHLDTNPLVGPTMIEDMIKKADAQVSWRNQIFTYRGSYRFIIHEAQEAIFERVMMTKKAGFRQGTADHDKLAYDGRVSGYHTNPFITNKGYCLAIANGIKNIFMLKKGSMQTLQDIEARGPKRITTAFDRWGHGWRRPQGVVGSAGVLS